MKDYPNILFWRKNHHNGHSEGNFKATYGLWQQIWLLGALFVAVVVSTIDSFLLQRKFNLFTGGFLTPNYLDSFYDIARFLAISLIADIGLTIPLVALTLYFSRKIHINLKSAILFSIMVASGPLIIADYIAYNIWAYIGDAFKINFAIEVGCSSILEMFTTALPHLKAPLIIFFGASIILFLIFWILNRFFGRLNASIRSPSIKTLLLQNSVVFCAVLVIVSLISFNREIIDIGLKRKPSIKFFRAIGEFLTDVDRDGYGIICHPRDPEPLNSLIFPFSLEIPGNNMDENGIAGDLPLEKVKNSYRSKMVSKWGYRPNIILIMLESVRADIIGAKHNGKEITLFLNLIAKEGISVPLAYSHAGYTTSSRYHTFSGILVNMPHQKTLIDDFKANGYEVAFFSAQNVAFGGEIFDIGFSRGDFTYDARVDPDRRYTTYVTPGSIALPYQVIVEKILDFFKSRRTQKPLFLYVNLQDSHFPYYHSKIRPLINSASLPQHHIGPNRRNNLWATYINTVANVDSAIHDILETARHYLRDPKPGIIVLSDHGESLYDDGSLGHGFILNEIQTRIPLIVANLPMVIKQPFGQADLREALHLALMRKPLEAPYPVIKQEGGPVFQYLGLIRQPHQISFRFLDRRIIYDFHTRLFYVGGTWRTLDSLTESEQQEFLTLVHFWESQLVLAQAVSCQDSILK